MLLGLLRRGHSVASAAAFVRTVHRCPVWLAKLIPFKLADVGEGIAEVQVKEWHVKVGDQVKQFDKLCEVQSDKAAVTITSRFDGIVKNIYYNVDDVAKVGSTLLDIESEENVDEEEQPVAEQAVHEVKEQPETVVSEEAATLPPRPLLTPAVRRLAKENRIDLSKVRGTGKNGQILKQDILNLIDEAKEQPATVTTSDVLPSATARETVVVSAPPEDKTLPLRGYARTMWKTMTAANQIPHFTLIDEILVDDLMEMKNSLKQAARNRHLHMTLMPFFVKAASVALRQYPTLNSVLDEDGEKITLKAFHNIGIAIDTRDGLVVPNIKDCDRKSIWEIAEEMNRLKQKGIEARFTREDLEGGTFTISNIGAIGGVCGIPLIFPPQVAIMALGRIQELPRYDPDGVLCRRHLLSVGYAADHRIIDGATLTRFSNAFRDYLENAASFLAELK